MSYKFKLKQSLEHGARRIALEQIDRALESAPKSEPMLWVHETRKNLKKIRALLRLVRDGLDKTHWRRLNLNLRDTGRLLSGQRDSDVRQQTLAYLSIDADRNLTAAIRRLQAESPALDAIRSDGGLVASATAVERLTALRAELAELAIEAETPAIERALARVHRAGRRAIATVRTEPTDEQFHDLRKIVQLHWRQMQLLVEAWPDLFKVRLMGARALAQDLGQEHDLATLAVSLETLLAGLETSGPSSKSAASPAAIKRIIAACRQAQATLRQKSIETARLLFAARPRAFASETAAYWAAATTSCRTLGITQPPASVEAPSQRRNAAGLRQSPRKSTRKRGGGDGTVRSTRKPVGRPASADRTK